MPNPKNAGAYPQEFWLIAEAYEASPQERKLFRLSFSEAVRWRHRFYCFRTALKNEGGAHRFKELFNAQLVLRDDDGQPVNMKGNKVGTWKKPKDLEAGKKHEWGTGPWTTVWIRPSTFGGEDYQAQIREALAQMEAAAKANPRPTRTVDLPPEHIYSTPEPTLEQMGLTGAQAPKARPSYDDVFKKMFDKSAESTAGALRPDPDRPTLEINETGTAVLSPEELMKREMLEDEKAGDNNGTLSPPDSKPSGT